MWFMQSGKVDSIDSHVDGKHIWRCQECKDFIQVISHTHHLSCDAVIKCYCRSNMEIWLSVWSQEVRRCCATYEN